MGIRILAAAFVSSLLLTQSVWNLPAAQAAAKPAAPEAASSGDPSIDAAERFVNASDRYLHHSKLHAGMKGYGLTVMKGTDLVKFDVEIVSVMTRWAPHQDVIIARCAGLGLESSGIIAGMSGSPVFVVDPADGKEKMIGAVAYGWTYPKEPLCGLQPITQMLAAGGFGQMRKLDKPTAKPQDASAGAATDGGKTASAGPRQAPAEFLAAVFNPKKIDYAKFDRLPAGAEGLAQRRDDVGGLVPLGIPLTISGPNAASLAQAAKILEPAGLFAVQGGAVTAEQADILKKTKFQPGSAIAVSLVTGDADMSGVGTVTEVIGDRILAFGHPMLGEGEADFSIAPAYIHAIVSTVNRSFKLGSAGETTGTLVGDRTTGVFGRVGPLAKMIPMTVQVDWKDEGRKEVYKYNITPFRDMAGMLSRTLLAKSLLAWRNLPEHHLLNYEVDVDYGPLGLYQSKDASADDDGAGMLSDLGRPLMGLSANPLGSPVLPKSIHITATIQKATRSAAVAELKVDGKIYQPGQTVTGQVTLRPYRQDRLTVPVRFALPADLPDGKYTLWASDATAAKQALIEENPQRFNPRTTEQLFQGLQELLPFRGDRIYLRLPLNQHGLALGTSELSDLPAGKAQIISEAGKLDTYQFSKSLTDSVATEYVVHGQASASFEVQLKPRQTILHDAK